MDALKFSCVSRTVVRIVLVLGFLGLCLLVQAQTPATPAGEGTPEAPYEVATLEHLYWLTQHPSEWGASYIQTADIDASPTALWNNGAGFVPIGNSSIMFTGTYHGQGHKISGLTINRENRLDFGMGFFGYTSGAVIEDLGLLEVDYWLGSGYVLGGMVGIMLDGTVSGCFVTGSIETQCTHIGGLVGYLGGAGEIKHSYSGVNIYSRYYQSRVPSLGGLVGNMRNGLVRESYSYGELSYSEDQSNINAGGLIGSHKNGEVESCFWDYDGTGQEESAGGIGLDEEAMRTGSSFVSWDFDGIWVMEEGVTYPFLRGNVPVSLPGFVGFGGGDGSESNPYQVSRLAHLHQIRNYEDRHFLQIANIDMAAVSGWDNGKGFNSIGTSARPFAGSYDGQGYVISELVSARPLADQVALFGHATGTMSRIGLVDAAVVGRNEVAALVGELGANGSVDQCFSTGNVEGNTEIGGLAGNIQGGALSNSYSECEVTGAEYVGGVAGNLNNSGIVTKSYSIGRVLGSRNTGGLLGVNEGGMVDQSYWNVESSGQPASAGGLGVTAAMMRQQSTYSGWDFTDRWKINEGESYAYLSEFPLHSMNHIIAGETGWRMYGSPFYQSTFATMVNNLWTQGYTDSDDPSAEANLFIWDEASGQWEVPESEAADMKPAQGFILYVYEDDDVDTPGIQGGFPKTITHNVNLVNALPLSVSLSYTFSEGSSSSGFNLLANPTSSIINWDQINKTNVTDSYYTWDAANKEYDVYQSGVGGINGGTNLIDPFRGYWVRALANPASISIGEPAVVDYEQVAPPPLMKQKNFDTLVLRLADETGKSDELRVVVREDASPGLDDKDALKLPPLTSSYFSLSSITAGNNLAIDSRPPNGTDPIVIDLAIVSVNLSLNKSYTLSLTQDELSSWRVELENLATRRRHNIRDRQVDVSTDELTAKRKKGNDIPGWVSVAEPNWQLILTPITAGMDDSGSQLPKELSLKQNYPNPFNPITTIRYELPGGSQVRLNVSDMTGRRVATLVSGYRKAGNYELDFDGSHLASGIYVYSLYTSYGHIQRRMTIIK